MQGPLLTKPLPLNCCMMATTTQRTWIFSFLFWLVGLSSWITITGLFNELSLMVKDLPEGFEIWSYITLISMSKNILICIINVIESYRSAPINIFSPVGKCWSFDIFINSKEI